MTELVKDLYNMKQGEIFNIIANTDPSSELEKANTFKIKYMCSEQVQLEDSDQSREVEKITLICELNGSEELTGFHSTSLTLNAQLKKAVIFFAEEIVNQNFKLNTVTKGSKKQYELRTV
ncbi:MAG: hypothetical protein FWF50_03845 [Defluviitaleaceae bacterium]|nr:hypothetical protein [Defluviitaleaceae bacterium]